MNRQSYFANLLPENLDDNDSTGKTIIADLILASSNKLRDLLGLSLNETINTKLPKIVTRKDPSLDNYFADLLLRACYAPTEECPEFEEIVIRGSQNEMPTKLNPQIVGSVLIGIGGQSNNSDFITTYDEHIEEGKRSLDSASQVVFFRHLDKYKRSKPGVRGILPLLNEINEVDSSGGARQNHLITMTKDLHYALYQQPGHVVEGLPAQWKRAVLSSILVAACLNAENMKKLDARASGKRLRSEWKTYLETRASLVEAGHLTAISKKAIDQKIGQTTSGQDPDRLLTLSRILFALDNLWSPGIVSFVIGFLLEALLQLQDEFLRMQQIDLPDTPIKRTPYSMIYYVMRPGDMLPHRGIIYRVREEQKASILVVRDPSRQTTAIFKGDSIPVDKWGAFITLVKQKEPTRWYVPVNSQTGQPAVFMLNGTRSYLESEPSALTKQDLESILEAALRATTPSTKSDR